MTVYHRWFMLCWFLGHSYHTTNKIFIYNYNTWTRNTKNTKRISSWHSTLVFVPITFKREENSRSCENLHWAEFSQTVFSSWSSVFEIVSSREEQTESNQTICKVICVFAKDFLIYTKYVVRGVVDTEKSLFHIANRGERVICDEKQHF